MTKETVKAIEALIARRDSVGVSDQNKYVFAAPTRGSAKHLRGPDCLNTVVGKVELESPNAVKSTKLRKYVATVSQIIDLSQSELEWLARHMGHDLSVHREYYRLHDHTLELSKVSRLLMAVDEGNAAKFQGKKLSEITVDGKDTFYKDLHNHQRLETFGLEHCRYSEKCSIWVQSSSC